MKRLKYSRQAKAWAPSLGLLLASSMACADPIYHPPGSMLSFGAVSHGQSVLSDITNPAAGAAVLNRNGNQYRFGIIGSIGAGVEFGAVDDLYEAIEAEADAFDADGIAIEDPMSIAASVDETVNRLNALLVRIEADGYSKAFATTHLPATPLVIRHEGLGGSLVFDINGSLIAKAYGLQMPIQFDAGLVAPGPGSQAIGDVTIDYDNETLAVDNDSSYVTRAAKIYDMALGYSLPLLESGNASLYAGLRAHYYKVELSRTVFRMGDVSDAEEIFEEARKAEFNSNTSVGVDFGLLWVSSYYRLGASFNNLNEPEFEYDPLDLSTYNSTSTGVGARLARTEVFTLERQLQLEAALFTASQNWIISAAVDANAISDAMGDEYQWATLSAAYITDSWLIPGVRLGYRANLSGTEISYITGGLTLFKILNLDVAWSPESVEFDGDTYPRGAIINLGLEASF